VPIHRNGGRENEVVNASPVASREHVSSSD
jgi:hypothetical protein